MILQIFRLTNLDTEKIGEQLWRLTRPLVFGFNTGPITVPKNFITDGASCPKVLWSFCSPMSGPQVEAAVLHDYLYSKDSGGTVSRYHADQIFLNCMIAGGTSKWRAHLIYRGVRMGGIKSWKECWSKDKLGDK